VVPETRNQLIVYPVGGIVAFNLTDWAVGPGARHPRRANPALSMSREAARITHAARGG
jgi:hypothetical protein